MTTSLLQAFPQTYATQPTSVQVDELLEEFVVGGSVVGGSVVGGSVVGGSVVGGSVVGGSVVGGSQSQSAESLQTDGQF
jgi:hypothetical protein